jgi:phosphohistidine phosphatase
MSSRIVPTLFLVRHARADGPKPGERDFDRILDEQGQADALRIAEAIRARGWSLGRVVASPARRCRQTADILTDANPPMSLSHEPALYDGPLDAYLTLIDGAVGPLPLTVVGHNPLVEQAAWACLGASLATQALRAGFLPAMVVAIARDPDGSPARLVEVLTP